MPAISSPAKLQKLWKKGTADYLKAAKIKELEPQEDFLNKKVLKGLDRLKVAATEKEQTDSVDFDKMRNDTTTWMDKFRKVFKPKKDKSQVKPFYQKVCRLTLVTEQLQLKKLDPDETEPEGDILDDLDADALDKRDMLPEGKDQVEEEEKAAAEKARTAHEKTLKDALKDLKPSEGNLKPSEVKKSEVKKSATPEGVKPKVNDEATAFTKKLRELMPDIQAVLTAHTTVTDEVRQTVDKAKDAAGKKEFKDAGEALEKLEGLLPTGKQEIAAAAKVDLYEKNSKGEIIPGRLTAEGKRLAEAMAQKDAEERTARRLEFATNSLLDKDKFEKANQKNAYTKAKQVGKGGGGTAFLLESDTDPNAPKVVVKVPNKPEEVKNMERELSFYEKIGPHPNIARAYGFGEVGGKKGLIMEPISGGKVQDAMKDLNRLAEEGKVSEEDYWGMMQFTVKRTLEALAFIEQQGVIHHDIKAPNILIDDVTGEPKIIDFDISSPTGEKPVGGKSTYGHHPLDGWEQGKADGKTDTFGVGGMTYEVRQGNDGETASKLFRYNLKDVLPMNYAAAFKYKQKKDGVDQQALHVPENQTAPTDKKEADALLDKFSTEKPGRVKREQGDGPRGNTGEHREKQLGKYGAATDYVDFINQLMHPDPLQRLSAADALKHPFLLNRTLDDTKAAQSMKELVAQRSQPDFGGVWGKAHKAAAKGFKDGCVATLQKINNDSKTQEDAKSYIKEQLAATGLGDARTLEALLGSPEDPTGALADFAKALGTENEASARDRALAVLDQYAKVVAEKKKHLHLDAGPDFCQGLLTALDELTLLVKPQAS